MPRKTTVFEINSLRLYDLAAMGDTTSWYLDAGTLFWLLPMAPTALAYRWSLKSTALVWLPVLWAIRAVSKCTHPAVARVRLLYRSDRFRLRCLLSVVTVVSFAIKLYLYNTWAQFADWWNATPLKQILAIYVQPQVLPRWQWAMVLNSLLALGMWFYLRSYLRHAEEGVPKSDRQLNRMLGASLLVSRVLSAYAVFCAFYLYLQYFKHWRLPELGDKWFPWM